MGYLEANNEQVEAAAIAAEIHDFILTLPQGYDTPIGDRGGQFNFEIYFSDSEVLANVLKEDIEHNDPDICLWDLLVRYEKEKV